MLQLHTHCPSRKEYMEIRQKVRNGRRDNKLNSPRINSFYTLDKQNHSPNKTGNTANISYATIASSSRPIDDNNDISNQKIIEIYFEALDALEKCKTKYNKFRVLGNMLRHVI